MGPILHALRLVEQRTGSLASECMLIDVSPANVLPPAAAGRFNPADSPRGSLAVWRFDAAHADGIADPHFDSLGQSSSEATRRTSDQAGRGESSSADDNPAFRPGVAICSAGAPTELRQAGGQVGQRRSLDGSARARPSAASAGTDEPNRQSCGDIKSGGSTEVDNETRSPLNFDVPPLLVSRYRSVVAGLLADWQQASSAIIAILRAEAASDELFSNAYLAKALADAAIGRVLLILGRPNRAIEGRWTDGRRAPHAIGDSHRATQWRSAIRRTSEPNVDVAQLAGLEAPVHGIGPTAWAALRSEYSIVLIDAGLDATPASWAADGAYLVVELNRTSRRWAQQTARSLAASGAWLRGCIVAPAA